MKNRSIIRLGIVALLASSLCGCHHNQCQDGQCAPKSGFWPGFGMPGWGAPENTAQPATDGDLSYTDVTSRFDAAPMAGNESSRGYATMSDRYETAPAMMQGSGSR